MNIDFNNEINAKVKDILDGEIEEIRKSRSNKKCLQ